ncbi:MAG: TlpA family protein disulfide reductase [Oscillospiraceae bacterium]|nr:TlpA family protein disulfide reductase [Oscillospiraceae bacterium]MBR0211001.1 TlpA family protein disulfide reductase [Oscillospiraceae bacterium]
MKKTIGIALALVAVLALAFVGYRYLSTHRGGTISSPDGVQEIVPMTDAAETAPDTAPAETGETGETGETAEDYTAPDFTAYTLTGEAVRLSDYAGKPVVINFWATWCPPCRQELPGFENAWQQYGDDVVFLMVECGGESVDEVESFIAEGGYTFPVYVDSDGSGAAAYGINAIPVTALVDAEGKVFAYQVGAVEEDSLRTAIDMLLNA